MVRNRIRRTLTPESGRGESAEARRWRSSLRQGDDDLHVVDGEEAGLAVDHALVPVLVDLVGEDDDVAFFEAQLTLVLRLKVVEGATAGLIQNLRLCRQNKNFI